MKPLTDRARQLEVQIDATASNPGLAVMRLPKIAKDLSDLVLLLAIKIDELDARLDRLEATR